MADTTPESHEGFDPASGAGRVALTPEDKETLRGVALDSVRFGLDQGSPMAVEAGEYSMALREPGAVFVTLSLRGSLRGCVGSYVPRRRLVEDVAWNAYGAAYRDSRFSPLRGDELQDLEVHLSLLTPLVPLEVGSRDELLENLRPGVDGLLLEDPPHRSTFLPQVWETLTDPGDFVAELFLKAGLSPDHWSSTLTFHRYCVEEF